MSYEGAWRDDKACGHGKATYPNGDIYVGDWLDDERSGWGLYTVASCKDVYEGAWEADRIHGKGRYSYAEGATFEGVYERGERLHGRLTSGDGATVYDGDWSGSERHGTGTLRTPALEYRGQWAHDMREGQGACMFADGSRYEGAYAADVCCGAGTLHTAGGDIYSGAFQGGAYHGEGVLKCASGELYEGGFVHGQRQGRGRAKSADGALYEGEWFAGKRHGRGREQLPCGETYSGHFEEGLRQGRGAATFADGTRFKGDWSRGRWVQSAAEPALCRLAGPGLVRATAGAAARFSLLARDEDRQRRLAGGDQFVVRLEVACLLAGADAADAGGREAPAGAGAAPPVFGSVIDNGDGSYACAYTAPQRAGMYRLHVTLIDGEPVGDSPYDVRVLAGAPDPRRTRVEGAALQHGSALAPGAAGLLAVCACDTFGNSVGGVLGGALPLEVSLSTASGLEVPVSVCDAGEGAYTLTFEAPACCGLLRLQLTSRGVCLGGSPFSLEVRLPPGATPPEAAKTTEKKPPCYPYRTAADWAKARPGLSYRPAHALAVGALQLAHRQLTLCRLRPLSSTTAMTTTSEQLPA